MMIRKTTQMLLIIGLVLSFGLQQANAQPATLNDYNIVWTEQSKDASESMPLVGGDIGCNVWVENGDVLLYVQRSGSLSENGEYLKLGRFRLQLTPNLFVGETQFRQELKLADGCMEIEAKSPGGQQVLITLWVEVDSPAVHMEVTASQDIDVTVAYESWRTQDKELLPISIKRERFTCFSLEGYPGKVIRVKDEIAFTDEGVLFYHRNPKDKLIPELLIKQQELEAYADKIFDDIKDRTFGGVLFGEGLIPAGMGEGTYQITPYKSWKLKSERPSTRHHIGIATHIEQTETVELWKQHLYETVAKAGQDNQSAIERTRSWWHAFWQRSHIFIHPQDPDASNPVWQMSRNYQLFRYQLGGNAFGEYPTKFNGGNLIYDPVLVRQSTAYEPDWRQWGGAVHTAQNQRLLYWPMLKAGDFDAILPQFELYRKGLPGAKARVKKHFGHEGAVFSEYMSAPGIVFGAGWGWEGNGHRARGKEIPFGDPRATGARGYKDMAEVGVMANQSCAYHWESQLEHAYMIMEYQRFSGRDISQYMPFIKAAVLFFDEHYQLRQKMRTGMPLDENGKLVIYPSTSCESYRGARNPSDILAGLQACVKSLLDLDSKYVSSEEKAYYRGFLERIPDYSFAEQDGRRIIKPAEQWLKESNQELPQFYPLFPFDQFQLGDEEIPIFKHTYELAPAFRKNKVQSWHQDGIFFARMGMTSEAADYNTRKLQDSPRRFPTFWGPGHDWVPDHNWGGSGMIGLQEMLLQTIGDQILVFPAWPREWDVDFKLHAPQKTTVEAVLKNGELVKLIVIPETRRKDVVIGLTPQEKPAVERGKHLFILSGQSNMAGLDPDASFTPTVERAFGKDNVIVVKDALGGQPIRRWYKQWKPAQGNEPKATGDLYDRLMTKVQAAIKGKPIETVTFVWMQGERDAREQHGQVYAASFKGLLDQLGADLQRQDINFVVGRLSDFDMANQRYPHWTMVRQAQVALAEADPFGAWVDTDDLNDGVNKQGKPIANDLHYSVQGYETLGQRFAKRAIALIRQRDTLVQARPNIVIMLADDMGYGELQCLNPQRGKIKTPQLDAIAAGGMIFTDAHSGSAVCTPTRYGLMTGRYAWRTRLQSGVLTGGKSLIAKERLTLARMLKQKGYHTAMFGKWHLGMLFNGKKEAGEVVVGSKVTDGPIDAGGFDEFHGFHHSRQIKVWVDNDTVTEHIEPIEMLPKLCAGAVDYIHERKGNKNPFFVYVPWNSPHSPVVPSAPWQGKSGLNAHADFVMQTDHSYGRIIKALRDGGLLDNTLVICSSDNGTSAPTAKKDDLEKMGHFPSGDLRGSKADIWDGGHRVPFIAHWPRVIKAGRSCDRLVCLTDVMATVAEIVGFRLLSNAAEDSLSFLPALKGESKHARTSVIHHSVSGYFAVRQDKDKLIMCPGSGGWTAPKPGAGLWQKLERQDQPTVQLYDMSQDLGEQKNLAADRPEKVRQLRALLRKQVYQGRSTPGPEQANDAPIVIDKRPKTKKKNQ